MGRNAVLLQFHRQIGGNPAIHDEDEDPQPSSSLLACSRRQNLPGQ